MNVLVVGNTGPIGLGRAICERLAKHTFTQDVNLYALVRETAMHDPDKAAYIDALRTYQANIVHGDLKDQQSMMQACEGMDVVITTATITSSRHDDDHVSSVDLQGQTNLLNAAKANGVSHFIYTSYSINTQTFSPCPLTRAKQTLEQAVIDSGMRYTILRPSYFTECWLSPRFGFDLINSTANFYGSGERPVSYITTGNVADFAAASITNTHGHNAILELGGPEAVAPLALAKKCEAMGAESFTISHVSVDTLESNKAEAIKEGDTLTESLISLGIALAKGDPIDMIQQQKDFPEISLTSVDEHIQTLFSQR